MVDYVQLIKLVARRPALWDNTDPNYHSRDNARMLWSNISAELGCLSPVAKAKWRGLRDIFRKETHKMKKSENSGGKKRPRWKYYDYLLFLSNTLRTPRDNAEASESIEVKVEVDDDFDTHSSIEVTDTADYDTDEFQSVSAVGGAVDEYHGDPLISNSAQVSLQDSQQNNQTKMWKQPRLDSPHSSSKMTNDADGDYYFLMSLLPHLHDVPKQRKLSVRQALQQVLLNEETICNEDSNS